MLICPRCHIDLRTVGAPRATRFACKRCEGEAVSVAGLRRSVQPKVLTELWMAAVSVKLRRRIHCPSCLRHMGEVPVGQQGTPMHIDVCRRCHLVWLDRNEEQQLPRLEPPPPPPVPPPLHEDARRALALWKVEALRTQHDLTAPPSSVAGNVLGWLGFPIVEHRSKARNAPLATWAIALSMLVVSLWGWHDAFVQRELGFVASAPWRYGASTWLTSFFFHADAFHLIGNGYFLLALGAHVEELLGSARYLWLLLAAHLLGSVAHALTDLAATVPVIGASGGLSGMMLFFALAFPHARVRVLFVHRWLGYEGHAPWRWFSFSASEALVLWILIQLFGLGQQVSGLTDVSSAAHLGGASTGAAAWWWWRRR
jgi:membrane associated rhomboid family serine protease/Zn-finger nucleic acid-binding protein